MLWLVSSSQIDPKWDEICYAIRSERILCGRYDRVPVFDLRRGVGVELR